MVRDFQSIIGQEAREQILIGETRPRPMQWYACVGGGSNAMGIFSGFFDDPRTWSGSRLAAKGLTRGQHASRLCSKDASVGVARGIKPIFCRMPTAR